MEELIAVVKAEREALIELLKLLEEQYSLIVGNDVFALDAIVEKIQEKNKKVAEIEVKRRNILNGRSINAVSRESEELEEEVQRINNLLYEMTLQKDSNDILLKQSLSFTNKLLSYINPNRGNTTYNAYGKVKR